VQESFASDELRYTSKISNTVILSQKSTMPFQPIGGDPIATLYQQIKTETDSMFCLFDIQMMFVTSKQNNETIAWSCF
jgi:hypothetical protein